MKQTLTVLAALGLTSIANAGVVTADKSPITSPVLNVPEVCECFEAGEINLGFYGAGVLFLQDGLEHSDENYEDAVGGGVSFTYFATQNFGIQVDGTWLATAGTLHSVTSSLVYRLPMGKFAPYAFAGGGVLTDGVTPGTYHAGAGVEFCLSNSISLFADGRYTWTENCNDHALFKAGLVLSL
jgi:hypothetical protein